MASPMPMASTGGWNNASAAAEAEEQSVQMKAMALKVHYTFDKEAKINCLARGSGPLQVQMISISETVSIGIVDLRACIHTIIECSPELTSHECDYTIYVVDYSEPDTPLVGQGLFSWVLESMREPTNQPPKLVTGRVSKNLLGVFGGGNRETLEVRLKLSETPRVHRHSIHPVVVEQQASRPVEMVMTPTSTTEWNSLLQSNPQIGQSASHGWSHGQASRVASPALSQGFPPSLNRRDSFGPTYNHPTPLQEVQRPTPTPIEVQPPPTAPASAPSPPPAAAAAPAASSRPSSRVSNRPSRRKPPTGRPRGRPRKKPAEGNTSGYEDGTEGEEAPTKEEEPAKKRAKITKVDKSDRNAFASGSEPLRVTASNSSSLRNFRPIAAQSDGVTGSHLQEVPRAPTPVPNGALRGLPGRAHTNAAKPRRESSLKQPAASNLAASFSEPGRFPSPSQEDSRSPESMAPTPMFSEDSPPEIGSSPPVQRATPYMRSSPPPSSPVLPPMPPREPSVPDNDMDELFGEEPPTMEELPLPPPIHHRSTKGAPGVPIQVFQLQGTPGDLDMVQVASYNTPMPSSSALAPLDGPAVKQEFTQPRQVRPTNKRKRPRASSPPPPPAPQLAPTPPPTTDALEKAVSPPPTSAPTPHSPANASQLATPPALISIPTAPSPVVAPVSPPIPPLSALTPLPEPCAATSTPFAPPTCPTAPTPVSTTTPPPEVTQAVAQADDDLNDPIVQLASKFSSKEELFPPTRPASRTSQPQPPLLPQASKPSHPRQLNRSHSAGPLLLPCIPTSDPVGPSSLAHSSTATVERPRSVAGSSNRRSGSFGPLALPIPEPLPEPVVESPRENGGLPNSTEPEGSHPLNDNPPMPSSPQAARSNKNFVKKFAIKQRLEEAINNGEMPPFCSNCGAIETPTWRKIWTQERDGSPERCEFSEKPGRVTAVEVLKHDDDGKSTLHRIIKKSLATSDDKAKWEEALLCNPCGIWLVKWRKHRPADRWDKDASRLGQERRRKGANRSTSRAKKNRSTSEGLLNPTSEAYLPTDAIEASVPSPPRLDDLASGLELLREESSFSQNIERGSGDNLDVPAHPGSTHSRGSGTAQSPIDIEFDEVVGTTKRLLFPSPRKDGVPKVLCDVNVNLVQTSDCPQPYEMKQDKENAVSTEQDGVEEKHDDLESLFRSPPRERPSTPTSHTKNPSTEPFKTPTRPTPNHRPITRSVSRSIRSARLILSPGQMALERTPTKTPRSVFKLPGSGSVRRSPRNHDLGMLDSPISRSIVQLLSEGNAFGIGENELDINNLPNLTGESDQLIDFGNLLSTDDVMPSSPPKSNSAGIEFDYNSASNVYDTWMAQHMSTDEIGCDTAH